MTCSTTHNGQIPTDPAQLALLIVFAAAVIGRLTPEQADSLNRTLEFALLLAPCLLRGGR